MVHVYEHARPSVTVDCVVFGLDAEQLSVLLVERDVPPFEGCWALPGGFVYVTRPLLELCEQNSDEIAFILGHEMGHVVRRHAIERLISNTAISAATRTTRAGRLIGGQLAGLGAKFLTSAYSQAQEFEADLFGARLLRSSGLDPRGAVRALQRLQELGGRRDESVLAAYLSSHPPAGDRVERIQRLLTHLQRTQPRKSSR